MAVERPLLAGGSPRPCSAARTCLGSGVRAGILFTTANRTALSPAPLTQLVGYIVTHIGPILALALLGAVLSANSPTRRILAIGWLATAAILPASQMHLGEAVSFEKHLAYSALFLAPLAGIGVKRIGETRFRMLAVFLVLWVVAVCGLSTSKAMYEWPSVDKVIAAVTADPHPGMYLSTSARSLAYYTRDAYPQITWEEHYGLFDRGDAQIAAAVTNKTYERVIFQSGTSGNPVEDARQAVFVAALKASPDYQLVVDPFPVREDLPRPMVHLPAQTLNKHAQCPSAATPGDIVRFGAPPRVPGAGIPGKPRARPVRSPAGNPIHGERGRSTPPSGSGIPGTRTCPSPSRPCPVRRGRRSPSTRPRRQQRAAAATG